MTNEYSILLQKLDSFIKKYYVNKILKGTILSVLIILIYNSIIFSIEYFNYLSPNLRTFIFYTSVVFIAIIVSLNIIQPVLKYFKLGKMITYEQASEIIAKYFSEVEDKLLNILELAHEDQNSDLVLASIDQKINKLKPIPFLQAIDIKRNLKYLRYYLFFLLFVSPFVILYPRMFVDGAERIIKHDKYFEPKAPFDFTLKNDSLTVRKGEDFTVELKIEGSLIPDMIEIEYGNYAFFMQKKDKQCFTYTFESINNSIPFNFKAGEFSSKEFEIEALPNPQMKGLEITVDVPSYTGIKDFTQNNNGDIIVPEGSVVEWNCKTNEVDKMNIYLDDSIQLSMEKEDEYFNATKVFKKNMRYTLKADNEYFKNETIINYSVTVVPDLYPEITVMSLLDTAVFTKYYYKGVINDDYGFSNLYFVYINGEHKERIALQMNKNLMQQEFYFEFDFSSLSKADKVDYYFEVFDNDAVNGKKSVKTQTYSFELPRLEEIKQLADNYDDLINSSLKSSKTITKDINEDIESLREKLLQENLSDWQKKEILEDIKSKHDELKQLLDKASEINKEKNNMLESLTEQDKEILEKQKQIEKLLEKVMDSEMQDLLDELEKLMENFDKNEFFELSEDMKMSYDDLSEQLDKNLEMLKRFEVEQDIQSTIDRLKELADEQKKLADEMKSNSQEENKQAMDSLNDEFNKIKDEYKEALEKNKSIDKPFQLDDFEEEFNKIQEQMQQAGEENQKGKSKKSSEQMQQSSEQMQQLSDMMDQMMQANQQQQTMEDIDNLRQILDNLITFSFKQEDIMDELRPLSYKDPKTAQLAKEQNLIKENFEIIRDSLQSLASRVPAITSKINTELLTIKKELAHALDAMEQMRKSTALRRQQTIMTSTNNLALLLSEIVQQMQQSAANQMSGQQQCENPSSGPGGKPSLQQMKQSQQSMKEQLQQMINQMKTGNTPGNQGKLSKQYGEMLAKQQMYKEMLSKMQQSGNFSPETMQQLKEIERMMNQTENDIINKNITPQTMYRQEQILTRLLEAEKAERERDIDDKRKSKEAKEIYSNPQKIFENISKENLKFNDRITKTYLQLNTFYRKKYDKYLLIINNIE